MQPADTIRETSTPTFTSFSTFFSFHLLQPFSHPLHHFSIMSTIYTPTARDGRINICVHCPVYYNSGKRKTILKISSNTNICNSTFEKLLINYNSIINEILSHGKYRECDIKREDWRGYVKVGPDEEEIVADHGK